MNRMMKVTAFGLGLGLLASLGGCVYPAYYGRPGVVYSDDARYGGNAAVDSDDDADYAYDAPGYYSPAWYGGYCCGYGYGWPAVSLGFYGGYGYWGGHGYRGPYRGGYYRGGWGGRGGSHSGWGGGHSGSSGGHSSSHH